MEKRKNIEISGKYGKNILLDLYAVPNNKPKPIIIFSHGFKGFKDWGAFNLIAEKFAKNGFIFIKFNFSHNGTTKENPSEITNTKSFSENNFSIELDDLKSVIDWCSKIVLLEPSEVNKNEIYLLGHSRGGTISIIKASEDERVKKLVSWGAVSDISYKWNKKRLEQWEKKGVLYEVNKRTGQELPLKYQLVEDYIKNKDRFNINKAVNKLKVPFLVLHGTEDESVPFEHAINLKKWNKAVKLELIPNGSHTWSVTHPYKDYQLPFDCDLAIKKSIELFRMG